MILLFDNDFISGTERVCISGRRFEHIKQFHQSQIGDTLSVGRLNGKMGKGVINQMDAGSLEMDVSFSREAPLPLDAILVLSLPRPPILKRVLFQSAMQGIKDIHLIHSYRVEKSYWNSSQLRSENVEENFILGLEQGCDTILPKVSMHKRFRPFAEDILPKVMQGRETIVAHPDQGVDRHEPIKAPAVVIVGPEGGFIDYEIEQFQNQKCKRYGLGQRILKVDCAVSVLISRVIP